MHHGKVWAAENGCGYRGVWRSFPSRDSLSKSFKPMRFTRSPEQDAANGMDWARLPLTGFQMQQSTCHTSPSLSYSSGGGIYSELGVACKYIEVGVSMQDRRIGANCNGADETIHELADSLSFAAALTIDGSRLVIVNGSCGKDSGSRQKSTELMQVLFVARSCKCLHPNRVADCHILCEQRIYSIANRRTGIAKKFDPGRSIDEDHAVRLVRMASRSPSQPEPRNRRASSMLSGSAASVCNAKFTASRFVAN